MKVFRDMFIAVLLGVAGGVLVTVISYYNDNKEGGVAQTIRAVSNSFDVVADAYSVADNTDLLLGEDSFEVSDEVWAVLDEADSEELQNAAEFVLGKLLSEYDMEEDILVMDETDGNVEEGEPYSHIMRFHVRANSDSKEDQELKLAVKEDVVTFLKPLLED